MHTGTHPYPHEQKTDVLFLTQICTKLCPWHIHPVIALTKLIVVSPQTLRKEDLSSSASGPAEVVRFSIGLSMEAFLSIKVKVSSTKAAATAQYKGHIHETKTNRKRERKEIWSSNSVANRGEWQTSKYLTFQGSEELDGEKFTVNMSHYWPSHPFSAHVLRVWQCDVAEVGCLLPWEPEWVVTVYEEIGKGGVFLALTYLLTSKMQFPHHTVRASCSCIYIFIYVVIKCTEQLWVLNQGQYSTEQTEDYHKISASKEEREW